MISQIVDVLKEKMLKNYGCIGRRVRLCQGRKS